MKILKWLEEALYEIITWLVFYPRTMWRSIVRPAWMMAYSDAELGRDIEQQYTDTLSPPLFLVLTLLLIHLAEIVVVPASAPGQLAKNTPKLMRTHETVLAFRAIAFSIFPLLMATKLLRGMGIPLDRVTLKAPFYAQCYAAAPFAAVVSGSTIFQRAGYDAAGFTLLGGAYLWYLVVEARWFVEDLRVPWWRGTWYALLGIVQGTAVMIALVGLLSLGDR